MGEVAEQVLTSYSQKSQSCHLITSIVSYQESSKA